ncbi:type II toxin-antitoxin system Phd/YefM family antitoxin [Pseudomonas sp. BGr12]|uniref:type II toxin-antitoxin system Phd/YefM family antitoxin n=1 Tax=Pseudomonas sp. BGr12 TaxID=2936269 RepID=UPI00255997F7|nr:type II toxin-antitoxin system prevent-host-death family antitoxin [Pseudomonas sp. BJa5]MDL2428459.1 type II toxin-antitoxin system prevent-host-death family antitoxin [Pseudomonas sp. BJa5]
MRVIDIQHAKRHLSQLVEEAARGEPFLISKAGKPLVKVIPLIQPPAVQQRLGFLGGQIRVPEDFDGYGSDEIERLFS